MKQTISNACGTIGLLHAVGNNQDRLRLGTQPLESPARMTHTFMRTLPASNKIRLTHIVHCRDNATSWLTSTWPEQSELAAVRTCTNVIHH